MPKHTVNVPDFPGRRKMTAGQWLAEFRDTARDGQTRIFTLAAPVRLAWVERDERTRGSRLCRTSLLLFRYLDHATHSGAVLVSVSWRGAQLGAQGLYALNHALRSPFQRRGGLNIVRGWLEHARATRTPLRDDWPDLLAFLEIRPIPTLSGAQTVSALPSPSSVPSAPHAKHYV